jgi:hypothetical protein
MNPGNLVIHVPPCLPAHATITLYAGTPDNPQQTVIKRYNPEGLRAPLTYHAGRPGLYRVVLSAPGYKDATDKVTLAAGGDPVSLSPSFSMKTVSVLTGHIPARLMVKSGKNRFFQKEILQKSESRDLLALEEGTYAITAMPLISKPDGTFEDDPAYAPLHQERRVTLCGGPEKLELMFEKKPVISIVPHADIENQARVNDTRVILNIEGAGTYETILQGGKALLHESLRHRNAELLSVHKPYFISRIRSAGPQKLTDTTTYDVEFTYNPPRPVISTRVVNHRDAASESGQLMKGPAAERAAKPEQGEPEQPDPLMF